MSWIEEHPNQSYTTASETFTMKDLKQTIQIAREQMEWAEFDIPKDRFVEYEPKDREWLEYFGFIKKRPRFDSLFLHPDTMKALTDRMNKKIEADVLFGIPLYSSNHVPVGVCVGVEYNKGLVTGRFHCGSFD